MRRLYPPLIGILLIIVVVGILDHGGSKPAKTGAKAASAPRSVFPTPSTVPTSATPPVVTPAPTVKTQPAAAPGRPCQPVQVNGRSVSVTILKGQVICNRARAVVAAFETGKGRPGGSPPGQYRTVLGWRCVPSGNCTRPGKAIKAA